MSWTPDGKQSTPHVVTNITRGIISVCWVTVPLNNSGTQRIRCFTPVFLWRRGITMDEGQDSPFVPKYYPSTLKEWHMKQWDCPLRLKFPKILNPLIPNSQKATPLLMLLSIAEVNCLPPGDVFARLPYFIKRVPVSQLQIFSCRFCVGSNYNALFFF